jgi:superfamily I DNA/RNA helicase
MYPKIFAGTETMSPRRLSPEEWRPTGIGALEANALKVVRSTESRSVIAGPGAGKTELLAQRAAFLLQTGASPAPRRILAISFKKDAATNLTARVRQRCGPEHAVRFDSLTFDAFAKGLIDRFGQILPTHWRPHPHYELIFPIERDYREFLQRGVGAPPAALGSTWDVQAVSAETFVRDNLFAARLAKMPDSPSDLVAWLIQQYWAKQYRASKTFLSFPMIGRLVELLLRTTPVARNALHLTYSHVFLDEFQDTTQVQYDLVQTIFNGSDTVLTAVGDNKQQIMRWAMAMEDPFSVFEADFAARRVPLFNNYRSSPELVRIQSILAKAIDDAAPAAVSKARGTVKNDSCVIWDFATPKREAEHLARFIATEMKTLQLEPRDIVLIVRQKAADYAPGLATALKEKNIMLRNEAEFLGAIMLQELLAEEVTGLVLSLLRLAMTQRAGRHWTGCLKALATLRGVPLDDERRQAGLARELDSFAVKLARDIPQPTALKSGARETIDQVVNFVGRPRLIARYPAYGQGGWLDKVLNGAAIHLSRSSAGASDWKAALDGFEGTDAVPLMTIHKSKGLEYHTVIFVGLDDEAWWSFDKDKKEATAGFFVAFTRAKQRVVFTYCEKRGGKEKIAPLYDLLTDAGVRSTLIV